MLMPVQTFCCYRKAGNAALLLKEFLKFSINVGTHLIFTPCVLTIILVLTGFFVFVSYWLALFQKIRENICLQLIESLH